MTPANEKSNTKSCPYKEMQDLAIWLVESNFKQQRSETFIIFWLALRGREVTPNW